MSYKPPTLYTIKNNTHHRKALVVCIALLNVDDRLLNMGKMLNRIEPGSFHSGTLKSEGNTHFKGPQWENVNSIPKIPFSVSVIVLGPLQGLVGQAKIV